MPTYPFRCPNCGDFDVWQSIYVYDGSHICECGAPAKRRYCGYSPSFAPPTFFESHFNPAFGCHVSSKAELDAAKGRTEERVGHDLVNIPDLDAWEPSPGVIEAAKDNNAKARRAKHGK